MMKRCIVNDAGVVQYYLDPADSTKKADGTASVLTGADGQVMVEIPAFYYKHSYANTIHHWEISLNPATDFTIHPAFLKDGTQTAFRYIGAYEGTLYDISGSAYTDGNVGQVKDFTPTTGDKLSSVSGKLPVTNGTRANFRAIAANRGIGWRQQDFYISSAIQLLYLIEYASFNSLVAIGSGITNVTDWAAYNNYYPIAPSGNSNVIGNATGNTAGAAAAATEVTKHMSYRGIENFYGHLWKWVDGMNINNNRAYVSNTRSDFADDTTINYTDTGVNMINADGYQATLLNISTGFLPASVGASSSTKITDYYWQSTGWRVGFLGGDAYYGLAAGACCWYLANASAALNSDVGGRLCR